MAQPEEAPMFSVSATQQTRDQLAYIQHSLGIRSRSGAVAMAVKEMYDRLQEVGMSKIRIKKNERRN